MQDAHISESRFFESIFVESAEWSSLEFQHLRNCVECAAVYSELGRLRDAVSLEVLGVTSSES